VTEFEQKLVADLRLLSHELLEPGAAPAVRYSAVGAGSRRTSDHERLAAAMWRLLPDLVGDLRAETESLDRLYETSVPRRGLMPRSPGGYAKSGDRLVPRTWLRSESVVTVDIEPLRWLLHIAIELHGVLVSMLAKYTEWVEEAKASRAGESEYALADLDSLEGLLAHLQGAANLAARLVRNIRGFGRPRLVPRPSLPRSVPSTPAWASIRRHAERVTFPDRWAAEAFRAALREPIAAADLPYLYQRWCGQQLIEALRGIGFAPQRDVTGPLLLGGEIVLARGELRLSLWVEPRIRAAQPHRCGLMCLRGDEATPDFVLCAPGLNGVDYHVLDSTLSSKYEIRAAKSKYLQALATFDARVVAGNQVHIRPIRAWAAAPVQSPACMIGPELPVGSSGVIPLHPLSASAAPLRAWLHDIVEAASAAEGYRARAVVVPE